MPKKAELLAALAEKGIEVPEGKPTNKELQALLDSNTTGESPSATSTDGGEDEARITPTTEEAASSSPAPTEDKSPKDFAASGKDDLQQYQYGRELPLGDPRTNPAQGSKALKMKDQLLKQPRTAIFIPRADGESAKVNLSVTLNGYRLDLPKQTYLELPRQIAEVIMESQKQTVAALQPFRIDRVEKRSDGTSVAEALG